MSDLFMFINTIRNVAMLHNYAIGVHGSLVRDIDLIAVPWTTGASHSQALLLAIGEKIGYNWDVKIDRETRLLKALFIHPHAVRVDCPTCKGTWQPKAIDMTVVLPVNEVL